MLGPAGGIALNSAQRQSIGQTLLFGAALLCTLSSALFGFFYYVCYWRYRDLFNEEGRYFDENHLVVYHDQNAVLIIPSIVFLLLAVFLFAVLLYRRRSMVSHFARGA